MQNSYWKDKTIFSSSTFMAHAEISTDQQNTARARVGTLVLVCVLFVLQSLSAIAAESYKGSISLPIDLYTLDGVRLPKGRYETEVKLDEDRFILSFRSEGKTIAAIGGDEIKGEFPLPATVPILGTQYLRSSAEPLQTAQERQFSKTGLPQYAEETRDWKAALRAYKGEAGSVFFIFLIRGEGGAYRRVDFKLSGESPARR